ncbi:MAG: YdeI/OmpD-associated family protein [Nanoarchaeota archaeon]
MTAEEIYFKDIKSWRLWLEKNHLKESKIAVIRYKKHTGKNSPTHLEFMHEAICFGWIDTTVKRIDDEKYVIRFAKRTDKSRWSNNTMKYGKKLLDEDRMVENGKKRYLEGLGKETIDHGLENLEMPKELELALKKNKMARENFEKFGKSYKKMYYRWIVRAKGIETKKKRILAVVARALERKSKW